jgi:tRNA A37 methylthiotransferase MiaB
MQREISHAILHSRRGRVLPVMIDRVSEDPAYSHEGRTEFDAPEVDGAVFVNSIGAQVGRIAKVTVRESNDYDLFGTVA